LEEGILPGAGKALLDEAIKLKGEHGVTPEMDAAIKILSDAIAMPSAQILINAGLDPREIYGPEGSHPEEGIGYNVKTGVRGDLIEMGVIDPFKVTRSALQNAVSVATTILSTDAIITMARTYQAQ
jgi:chaperonin GroEL